MNLLHLSNSDIRVDPRILKELYVLESLNFHQHIAIGIDRNSDNGLRLKPKYEIKKTKLITKWSLSYSSVFRRMPRAFCYVFGIIEITVRFFLEGLKLRPAVVHCHGPFVLPAGVLLNVFVGSKLIYDAHELESNKNGQSRAVSAGVLIIEKICWRRISYLISVSKSIIDWYEANLGKKENSLVLNAPIIDEKDYSISKCKNDIKYFHKTYNIPKDNLVFLYLGAFGKGRGIELVLEQFAYHCKDADVVFMGYGDLATDIEAYCEKYQNIHIHKPMPQDKFIQLASFADVGLCLIENVSLSDYYCLPNKLFEYISAGLHVLGSDFPEIKKYLEKYSLGTCCTPESNKIRQTIQYLIDDRPSNNSRKIDELSWDAQANNLLDGYYHLMR